MSLFAVAGPMLALLAEVLQTRRDEVAKQTGLSADAVSQVSTVVRDYLSKDERALQVVMNEIDKARQHDALTVGAATPPLVHLLRGLVRPVITLAAFFWYVYARTIGIELGAEDYAILGGVMAFWFGFRPFEKAAVWPNGSQNGKPATVAKAGGV